MGRWNDWKDYSRTVVTGFRSSSGWENSYYGGYRNVLWDHPEITLNDKLGWENPNTGQLGYYIFNKLIKLYLLTAKKQNMQRSFTQNVRAEKMTEHGQNFTRYHFTKKAIADYTQHASESKLELSNMFKHYKDIINETDIYYDVPDEQEGPGEGNQKDQQKDGKGSGEGKDQGENQTPESGEGKSEGESQSPSDAKSDPGEGEGQKAPPRKIKKPDVIEMIDKVLDEIKERKIESHYINTITSSSDKVKFDILQEGRMCQYTESELLYAGQLLNLLDISFDPAEDKIQSLKSGKLDVNKICEVSAGNFNVYSRMEENINTKPFSVCVLTDTSGSMGDCIPGNNLFYAVKMMKVLYKAFSQIIPLDKLYSYSHTGYTVKVYNDKYNHNFDRTIGQVRCEGANYDSMIMEAVYNKVREYTDDNIIFITVSDGQPNAADMHPPIPQIKKIIEKCKRDGFVTMGIGVGYDLVKDIYPYHTVIRDVKSEFVQKTSLLINHVVKTEFQ